MSINKVLLIGNVGKDPEVRALPNGEKVATVRLATTEKYTNKTTNEKKEVTEWHSVIVWRRGAELVEQYVRKGTALYVEGKLRTRTYKDAAGNDKYATEVVADNIQLLGSRPAQQAQQTQAQQAPAPVEDNPNDDLPF